MLMLSTLNKECGLRSQNNREVKQLGREGEVFDSYFVQLNRDRVK